MRDDLFGDTRAFFRARWARVSWRSCVSACGFVFSAIGSRLQEYAARPSPESAAKLVITVRKEWEARTPVEAYRDEEHVVVLAGARFLRFKR